LTRYLCTAKSRHAVRLAESLPRGSLGVARVIAAGRTARTWSIGNRPQRPNPSGPEGTGVQRVSRTRVPSAAQPATRHPDGFFWLQPPITGSSFQAAMAQRRAGHVHDAWLAVQVAAPRDRTGGPDALNVGAARLLQTLTIVALRSEEGVDVGESRLVDPRTTGVGSLPAPPRMGHLTSPTSPTP
jgi:hypothetical protein